MQILGRFTTPWGPRLHVVCCCGRERTVPLTQRTVRCRRCHARHELAHARPAPLPADDERVPPPCR